VRTAFVVFTLLEFGDLLKSILHELDIPARGNDTLALLEAFYLYLTERPQDEIVTIIIDEAQGLDTSVLEDLVRLWAGPDPQYLQPQIVLVGHPELAAKLDSQELGSLREKIAVRRHISPLTRQESNLFIDHRLRIVGSSSSEVFKPEAVDRICDCAEGNPRVITAVCDGSLLIGYAKYKRKIDAKIVNEAIQDLRLVPPGKAKRRLPEPLPAEGAGPGEPVPEPVPVPRLRWRPVYQTLTGALLGMVALALFNLFIWDRAPREGMTVKGTRAVIAEKGPTLSVLGEQSQGLVPVPSPSAKRARPQGLVHKQGARPQGQRLTSKQRKPAQPLAHDEAKPAQPLAHHQGEPPERLAPYRLNDAERGDLLLKEDAAWRVLQR
jgi:hypothetical protein